MTWKEGVLRKKGVRHGRHTRERRYRDPQTKYFTAIDKDRKKLDKDTANDAPE